MSTIPLTPFNKIIQSPGGDLIIFTISSVSLFGTVDVRSKQKIVFSIISSVPSTLGFYHNVVSALCVSDVSISFIKGIPISVNVPIRLTLTVFF